MLLNEKKILKINYVISFLCVISNLATRINPCAFKKFYNYVFNKSKTQR